jgi:elongation factor G
MKCYEGNEIRNVAILGHSGCGKTTLVEAALFSAGVTNRQGRVEDGNTVSDYDPEEAKRRVSIGASIIPIEWLNNKINFIDTPGYFDFVGEAKQALAAADLALIVLSAKSGIEVGTEKAWRYAEEAGIPKMFFINGMDDENADFDKVVEQLKEKFGTSVAPLQVPLKEGEKFVGFIDVIKKEGKKGVGLKSEDCAVPGDLVDVVDEKCLMLEEAIAETDEALMEKFFSDERFSLEEIQNGIKEGMLTSAVAPVICGAASHNVGVATLMNVITEYVPPASKMRTKVTAKDLKTDADIEIACEDSGKPSLFIFKTIASQYGRLSIFRVMSGTIKKDMQLLNSKKDFSEKAGQPFVVRGEERIEVAELKTGDIGGLLKLQNSETGDTLCVKEAPIEYPPIKFPESLMSMAIAPKGKGDEDKIGQALAKMLEEDKTLKFEINTETKQSLVFGIGDNQLDILLSKLKNKYKLEAEYFTPIVPYREMIKGKVRVQGKYKKQSGGSGQYGDVHMEFEPSGNLQESYVFEEKIFGGSVPRQYFPAVEKGVQECVKAGPMAGYPVVGIKCILVDGSYHAVDSSELAFKMAAIKAFKDAFVQAKPAILEPIAKVEVFIPDDYTGDIMGDMNKRRGRILGMDKVGPDQKIAAEAPLAEMFKYATDLRSMTQGRGYFTMAFDRYEEAPNDVQQKVIEARKKEMEQAAK